ncbi:hypothetical protein [Stakelama tenebrarum]|uniref:Uncharacterized protein n=1 Tax=Stakelama tenebrarum TaxID=2711215 RepID=A0A6G6Y674_9SPHN|nr:hypothetical protein [Sphingosinithalassobacter tenebrarum]QIG80083.1 hypothetical protein G5C33_10025 [Sphingosinithalassobacter tenebrarum]
MTKLRPPLSFEAAIQRVVALLPRGYETAGAALGRSARFVGQLGDPDRREQIKLRDALKLDQLYRRFGGRGAPLLESYQLQLGVADLESRIDEPNVPASAIELVREGSEAVSASIAFTVPGATERTRTDAIRETEELAQACQRALAQLRSAPLPPPKARQPP